MTSSYVKVYTLECLILTKMNLTHKSQSVIFFSLLCHASQSSYMRSDYGLTGSEPVSVLFAKDTGKERVREKRNNWIRQNKCLCYTSKYHI